MSSKKIKGVNHVYRFVSRLNRASFIKTRIKPYSIISYDNEAYAITINNKVVALSLKRKIQILDNKLSCYIDEIMKIANTQYLEVETLDKNHFEKVVQLWDKQYKVVKNSKVEQQIILWCNDIKVPNVNNNSVKDVITHDDKYISVLVHFNTVIAVRYSNSRIMLLDSKVSRSTSRRCNMLFNIASLNGLIIDMVSKQELDDYMLGLYLQAKKVITQE